MVPAEAVPPASTLVLKGSVHGGQQPIAGATIQLYYVGNLLDGSPVTPRLSKTVLTDANGGFDITGLYTCDKYSNIAYLTATGGNPGLGAGAYNPNSALMVLVDSCGALTASTFVNMNELTTAAAVVAYGQFFSTYPNISYAWTNGDGYNHLAYNDELVNWPTGTAPGPQFPAGQQFPFPTLNTMANVISACVNSAGGIAGDSTPCGKLLSLTTPPAGSNPYAVPTNTVDALLNMQRYATQNVAQIAALVTPAAPFQPAASSTPANWYMRVTPGAPATPRYTLCTVWGDSLALGSEDFSGITIADTLPNLSSCYWGNNQGVGGQNSTQVAIREGGLTSTATIAGGVIPASGPVNVSFPDNSAPVAPSGPGQTPTTLDGVPGFISYDYNQSTNVFTRTNPGVPVPSPANTPYNATITNENSGFVILWAGRNDGDDQTTLLLNNLASMVAVLPSPKHFVILSVPNSNEDFEYLGQPGYNSMLAKNQAIQNAYPNNYIDARALVIANYDPTNPEDVIDHNHDIPSSSMRALDGFGDLVTGIDDSTCNFAIENANFGTYSTMIVDQEKIRVTDFDGTNIHACIRGYAGTTAAPHAAKKNFTGTDYLHLNHIADILLANAIDAYIQSH